MPWSAEGRHKAGMITSVIIKKRAAARRARARELSAQGHKAAWIARELGLSRWSVQSYLKDLSPRVRE